MDELISAIEDYLYTGKPNETLDEVDTDDDEDETSMEEEHTTINKTKYLLTPLYYGSMSTNFVFNGVTKKIRAPNITPSMVAELFNLVESSIVLTDSWDYFKRRPHLPERNGFNPPLQKWETYTIDAITLDELERFKALSIRSLNNDIVGIQGAELDVRSHLKFYI